jgi:hypothetical protein
LVFDAAGEGGLMRFHGWFQGSGQELLSGSTTCEEKRTSPSTQSKRPPPHINKKGYPALWVAMLFICLEFQLLRN